MEYLARLEGVSLRLGSFQLQDVNLAVPGGTVVGLIGENGAGKTTALRCLLGIRRPDRGEVILPPGGLADVGYVPDQCPFPGTLTVNQTEASLAGMFPRWDGELFEKYRAMFGLERRKEVRKLSRGMGMKLSLAAALAHRPRLLVLDEATAGLDPVARDEILDGLRAFVSDEDHGVLLSSHITSDLEKLCDYVAYLHQGRLALWGAKDEVLDTRGKLSCGRADLDRVDPALLAGVRVGEFGCQALVADRAAFAARYPHLPLEKPTLEDIMIFTARGDAL